MSEDKERRNSQSGEPIEDDFQEPIGSSNVFDDDIEMNEPDNN